MTDSGKLGFDALNAALKAAGEDTRLRILALLAEAELTVSDLTDILRQSQPRISRHLKLLAEAGLVERFREGTWAFFRLARRRRRRDRRTRCWRNSTRPTASSPATASGWPRCAPRAPPPRKPISASTPPSGTASASCTSPTKRSKRRSAKRCRAAPVPLAARSRHRHRPHARTVRPADRARARPRSVARHAARWRATGSSARACAIAACGRATSTTCRCRTIRSTSSSCIRCCTSSTTARAP